MRRFYLPEIKSGVTSIVMAHEELHHARNVLRLAAGDEISVFDGNGREFLCRIEQIGKDDAEITVLREIQPAAPESPIDITLASVAIPGDRYDLIVQKAVELGVTKFVPLSSVRCELKQRDLVKKMPRWLRIGLDASKQCGRTRLMKVAEPQDVRDYLSSSPATDLRLFFSERDGSPLSLALSPGSIIAIIGPKGGWDDAEISAAREADFDIVTLGGRIMRAETAAISLTAILQHRFGDLN